jgi:hypothetical protein
MPQTTIFDLRSAEILPLWAVPLGLTRILANWGVGDITKI